jgi:hypothetical protein
MLCEYRDILGKPNEGFHAHRFLGFALFDILGTIFISFMIMLIVGASALNFAIILFCVTLLGMFLHWLFCVPTKLNSLFNFSKDS